MASILVVDDEDGVVSAYEAVLRYEGYAVMTARTSSEALQLLESRRPNLVLLDIRLGKRDPVDGLEVLRQMRTRVPGVKVVMVSAYLDRATRQRAVDTGALACWTKPITVTTLVERTREVFASSRV